MLQQDATENVPARPSIQWANPHFRPYFDPISNQQNITAQLGKSTFLICNIRQITDESVSHFSLNYTVAIELLPLSCHSIAFEAPKNSILL